MAGPCEGAEMARRRGGQRLCKIFKSNVRSETSIPKKGAERNVRCGSHGQHAQPAVELGLYRPRLHLCALAHPTSDLLQQLELFDFPSCTLVPSTRCFRYRPSRERDRRRPERVWEMGNGRCRWREDETFSSWKDKTVDPQRSVPAQVWFDVVLRVWRFAELDRERLVRDMELLWVGEVFGERQWDVEQGGVREEEEHRQTVGAYDQTANGEGRNSGQQGSGGPF